MVFTAVRYYQYHVFSISNQYKNTGTIIYLAQDTVVSTAVGRSQPALWILLDFSSVDFVEMISVKRHENHVLREKRSLLSLERYVHNYDRLESFPSQFIPSKHEPDEDDKIAHIFWSIIDSGIRLALAVKLKIVKGGGREEWVRNENELKRWVGFGITDMGGMIGSDTFIYAAGSQTVLDCYGVSYAKPHLDHCGQDWEYVNSTFVSDDDSSDSGWLVVEVTRSLIASDVNEDRPLIDDSSPLVAPTKIIVAWGHLEDNAWHNAIDLFSTIKPHGPMNKVKGDIRFFGSVDSEVQIRDVSEKPSKKSRKNNYGKGGQSEDGLYYIDLIPDQPYHVPAKITTYKSFCFTLSDFEQLASNNENKEYEFYIVKFEDILSENENRSLVHHMDLHGTTDSILGGDVRLCRAYMDMIHPWEAGASRVFSLPAEAGIPIGPGIDAYEGFRVQIHYHNPGLHTDRRDKSGVRIYYVRQKPKYIAALMLIGDPNLELIGRPTVTNTKKGGGGTRHSFYCPPSCFTNETMNVNNFVDENDPSGQHVITVFKEVFHMHKTGARMTSIQFNSSGEPVRAAEINYFDFRQSAGFSTRSQVPFQIQPGDSFATTCYFEEPGVLFGSGSNQEMCQIFLWYYPKSNGLSCSYYDGVARLEAEKSGPRGGQSDLSAYGCEVAYESMTMDAQTRLDRVGQINGAKMRNEEGQQCRQPSVSGPRPLSEYQYSNASHLSSWPSLLKFIDPLLNETDSFADIGSKTNLSRFEKSNQSTFKNTSAPMLPLQSCTLCEGGYKPGLPNKEIVGYESDGAETGWNCDEMDAFVPVMFSNPALVFMDKDGLPPCRDFQGYFGPMCGCPKVEQVETYKKMVNSTMSSTEEDQNELLIAGKEQDLGEVRVDHSFVGSIRPFILLIAGAICAITAIFIKTKKKLVRRVERSEQDSIEFTPIISRDIEENSFQ